MNKNNWYAFVSIVLLAVFFYSLLLTDTGFLHKFNLDRVENVNNANYWYRKALSTDPYNEQILYRYAQFLYRKDENAKPAILILEKIKSRHPSHCNTSYMLTEDAVEKRDYKRAWKIMHDLYKLVPVDHNRYLTAYLFQIYRNKVSMNTNSCIRTEDIDKFLKKILIDLQFSNEGIYNTNVKIFSLLREEKPCIFEIFTNVEINQYLEYVGKLMPQ